MFALAVSLPVRGPLAQKPKQDPPKFLRQMLVDTHDAEEASEHAEDVRATAEIERAIRRIGAAFESGDAELLEDCLAPRKIHISLKAQGEDAGYKGGSQIKFMFARLFDERHTRDFLYDSSSIESAANEPGAVYFRAEWTYVVLNEDDVVREPLRIGLAPTKSGWRIIEILAGSR